VAYAERLLVKPALIVLLAAALAVAAAAPAANAAGCTTVKRPAPKPDGGHKAPKSLLPKGHTYSAVFVTNCGTFTVRLAAKTSPRTVASFVALARSGYFDRTIFHRIVPGFVIQGGDPTQTGTGGPGYETVDAPPTGTQYVRGVVAMAKTQTEPAGAAGSQFFVVTGANVGLPPDYGILGRVTSGLPVVLRIGKLGNAQEQPTRVVEVLRVRIKTS
jgi:peptidyl-prolyl cis-trans isomerase B (cyclophilin B)